MTSIPLSSQKGECDRESKRENSGSFPPLSPALSFWTMPGPSLVLGRRGHRQNQKKGNWVCDSEGVGFRIILTLDFIKIPPEVLTVTSVTSPSREQAPDLWTNRFCS